MRSILRETWAHFRAGLAYQLVLIAARIHPPLLAELSDTMLKSVRRVINEDTPTNV